MTIQLNGKPYELPVNSSLTGLVENLNLQPMGIAFAIDNNVIKRSEWDDFRLEEGMKITMIKAVCGG